MHRNKRDTKDMPRYRHPLNINVGMIIFAIIFVYMAFSVYTYAKKEKVQFYEVVEGDIVTDYGYTSEVLGRDNKTSCQITNPISITFALDQAVSFETLKLYPWTAVRSASGNECANYPKKFTLEVSQDGSTWTPVDLNGTEEGNGYTVESLRNTELFPEVEAEHIDTDFGGNVKAKKVKISVSQVGPAVVEDGENRLQIMELELWNGVENVAKDVV